MLSLLVIWHNSLSSTGHSVTALQIIVIEIIKVYKAEGGERGNRTRNGVYLA